MLHTLHGSVETYLTDIDIRIINNYTITMKIYFCFAALSTFIKLYCRSAGLSKTMVCVFQSVWTLSTCLSGWLLSVLSALFFAVKQYVQVFDEGQPVVSYPCGHLNVMVQDKAEAKHILIHTCIYDVRKL